MKKTIGIFLMSLLFGSAFAQQAETLPAEITFEITEHNFGEMKEGTLANVDFKFTNTGKGPLILNTVQPSCGCTTPEWPKELIRAPRNFSKIHYRKIQCEQW
jgi:hypothetical protein